MVEHLRDYLHSHSCKGFHPIPHYCGAGDYLTYFYRNDPCFAQRVDDVLTVYLAFGTREVVGCKIEGVRQILQTAGEFGVPFEGETMKLGFFIFVGAANARAPIQKRRYDELKLLVKDVLIDRDILRAA